LSREFPRRPKTARGAIVALSPESKGPIVDSNMPAFIFQYNPETVTRTISSPIGEETQAGREKTDADSIVELVNLNIELDATSPLEQSNQPMTFVENGLHPALAALESIMHSQHEIDNPKPPVVLFMWGPNRIIPVRLVNLKVTEEAFDSNLNPIRARIELNMRVRELSEMKEGSLGYAICTSHLDHEQMFTRLYNKTEINREFLEQASSNIQQHLAIGKSQTKERKNKRLHPLNPHF